MPDFTELKQKHRAAWASGNYDRIAQGIQAVGDHVVRSARIRAGEIVLDIACGTGNTTLMARARDAVVTGQSKPQLLVDTIRTQAAYYQRWLRNFNYAPRDNVSASGSANEVIARERVKL